MQKKDTSQERCKCHAHIKNEDSHQDTCESMTHPITLKKISAQVHRRSFLITALACLDEQRTFQISSTSDGKALKKKERKQQK